MRLHHIHGVEHGSVYHKIVKKKELAWEFIKFLTLDEEQAEKHARDW